jgi:hypothetical protein
LYGSIFLNFFRLSSRGSGGGVKVRFVVVAEVEGSTRGRDGPA